jgi:hypothetical protein
MQVGNSNIFYTGIADFYVRFEDLAAVTMNIVISWYVKLYSHFHLDDGGSIYHRNVDTCLSMYMASHHRTGTKLVQI